MAWKLTFVVAVLAVVLPTVGYSVGLGGVSVHSALNQPLRAEIAVSSEDQKDLAELSARVADASDFQRAGLDRPAVLSRLRFEVIHHADGGAVISVRSTEPMREPTINVLIEIAWSSGRLLREYAVLLDPPRANAQSSGSRPANANLREPAPPETEANDTPPKDLPDHYGPIRREETLWRVAGNLRPDNTLSNQQIMVALIKVNPEYFAGGKVNVLKAGSVLRVPSVEQMRALSRKEAIAELRDHYQLWQDQKPNSQVPAPPPQRQPATKLTTGAPSAGAMPPIDPLLGKKQKDRELPPAARSVTQKGPGGVADAGGVVAPLPQQARVVQGGANANQRQNEDLQGRLADLEAQIAKMRQQIQSKDENLAVLQSRLGGANVLPVVAAPTVRSSVSSGVSATTPSLPTVAVPLGVAANTQPTTTVVPAMATPSGVPTNARTVTAGTPPVAPSGAAAISPPARTGAPPVVSPSGVPTNAQPVIAGAPPVVGAGAVTQPSSSVPPVMAQSTPRPAPTSSQVAQPSVKAVATPPASPPAVHPKTVNTSETVFFDPVLVGLLVTLVGTAILLGVVIVRRRSASTENEAFAHSADPEAVLDAESPPGGEKSASSIPTVTFSEAPRPKQAERRLDQTLVDPLPFAQRTQQNVGGATGSAFGKNSDQIVVDKTLVFDAQSSQLAADKQASFNTIVQDAPFSQKGVTQGASPSLGESDQIMEFDLGFLDDMEEEEEDMVALTRDSRSFSSPPITTMAMPVAPVSLPTAVPQPMLSEELDIGSSWESSSSQTTALKPLDLSSHTLEFSRHSPPSLAQASADLDGSLDLDLMGAGELPEFPAFVPSAMGNELDFSSLDSPDISLPQKDVPAPVADLMFGKDAEVLDNSISFDLVDMDESFDFFAENKHQSLAPKVDPEQEAGVQVVEDDIGNTLALAQSYLDWGDKESARELLREVVNEGNAAQRETAQSLLAKL